MDSKKEINGTSKQDLEENKNDKAVEQKSAGEEAVLTDSPAVPDETAETDISEEGSIETETDASAHAGDDPNNGSIPEASNETAPEGNQSTKSTTSEESKATNLEEPVRTPCASTRE